MYITKRIEVEVEVDSEEFTDDELVEELESRGYYLVSEKDTIQDLYFSVIMGNNEKTSELIRKIIWDSIGKIVTVAQW